MDDPRQRFEKWLASHFEPATNASGKPQKTGGVPRYKQRDVSRLNLMLGGAFGWGVIDRYRRGDATSVRVRRAVRRVVDIWDEDDLRRYQRDRRLAQRLSGAIRHRDRFGAAPDGGSLEQWARQVRARLDDTYDTDAPLGAEARQVWREAVPAPANEIRRQRYAA